MKDERRKTDEPPSSFVFRRSSPKNKASAAQPANALFLPSHHLTFLLHLAQAHQACAAPTLALVHSTLFAFGNEPTAAAQIFHYAPFHHFFVKATEQTVERFAITQSDGHTESPLSSVEL